ncbi:MAG: type I restriction endonuclease subunit R [Prevotella sp.]|nr:type I restriction endonuclease subunit R [Prevotella sp.]MDD7045938.1 type I restriction endonuclease subunit R [Prevotella sp.]MDY5547115.1 type I restriction endonuclease subunit R [Prevotella sp.]
MKSFISEDDIEQAICNRLSLPEYGWKRIECDARVEAQDEVLSTGRANPSECILPDVFLTALKRLNPQIVEDTLKGILQELRKDFTGTDMIDTNYRLYQKIRNGIKVPIHKNGKEDFDIVRLFDFDHPERNDFHCVNQMWIKGHYRYRRPDVLLFVNGLPVVFIELKNSTVKIEEAYNKNLTSYRQDIPNIFAFNQICVLSNGLQTKIGAWNSNYEFFFEWLRVDDEKEKLDREQIANHGLSVTNLIDGLFRKERLLDYIENFIFFDNKCIKIIAKNHQYLGVNNLMESVARRRELNGKLGVFWHTQGSGKSYSMVMFVRKVKRKLHGNFTFLVITDREDLDAQIHKTFVRTEVIGDKEECQPKNSTQLRDFLRSNKPMVFTLIHKFQYDKTRKYPLLSDRNDIFVLVDEAHRTQYKQLAENMHTGLPNANYIAFTGTPLLGSKRLTNQWFGDYVSEYNFAQAIEDGSTVPLFYSRRVPEVGLTNDWLDTDVDQICEDENLNDREKELLENSSSRIMEVIKRDERLDRIARDIAHHFPRRGFLGKGMVVSVDKYTAVRMYDKVQKYWAEEKKQLVKDRNHAQTKEDREKINAMLAYMNKVEMAVVISKEDGEEEKFAAQGLDITPHRKKLEAISTDGKDIEDRFKDKDDPLSLVFVCAMWLTGFDVPSLSTLYLDKPMKGHTLMQAIARANRVFPGKTCGIIVDYVNVFKYMQQALSDYASTGDDTEYPAKDIEQLIANIDQTIIECDVFLQSIGIKIDEVIAEGNTLDQLDLLRKAYNRILEKDEWKDRFKVFTNLLLNLYDAAKPEIFERGWHNDKFAPLAYLNGLFCNQIDDEKLSRAKARMAETLDQSVSSTMEGMVAEGGPGNYNYAIHQGKVIDLSKVDVEALRKEINSTPYKALEIDDLRSFIERALVQMINKNCTRVPFSQRYKNIIDHYNSGGSENEDYYEKLLQLIEDMKREQSRSTDLGLDEEELEIYDLLRSDRKLTKEEEQKVILASKNLYRKLQESKNQVMVVDWYKDEQPRLQVFTLIQKSLNDDLPLSYDQIAFKDKTNLLFNHFVDMAVQGYGWVV